MDNYLILVNAQNMLPEGFIPELSETDALGKKQIFGEPRALSSLFTMLYFAKLDGIDNFSVESGYRSYKRQQELFCGREQTSPLTIMPPGASEHQTGLAFDIVCYGYENLEENFCETLHYKWLIKNAHRFGFILRYPKGKEQITGVVFEPWHFRYVGETAAADMHAKGLCLEEYCVFFSSACN